MEDRIIPPSRFNIRVYGCVVAGKSVMILKEKYAGETLLKFPGGGLEFGEGVLDGLRREFLEELQQDIQIIRHFYTQEHFLRSKFNSEEQLLTLYYIVEPKSPPKTSVNSIEEVLWVPLVKGQSPLPLPTDAIVYGLLCEEFL